MAGITMGSEHMYDDTTFPTNDPESSWKIVLAGEKFMTASAALKTIVGCVKNPLITFSDDGLMIQGTVCGQRMFVPIDCTSFSEYEWRGPTAIFLALTDSRRTLLDAFKCDKKKVVEVCFTFRGEPPCRHLTQTVTYANDGCSFSSTIVKYELWSASIICPQKTPDATFSLNKQQLSKILTVAAKVQHEELIFALKAEGGFYAGTICDVISFDIDGSAMVQYPYNATSHASSALIVACGKKKTNKSIAVTAYGSGKPFCLALEDTNAFRNVVQKIKTGAAGADLGFYTTCDPPMLCVRPHVFGSPTAFLFCNSDCMSIYELEEVSAVSGAIKSKRISEYFPKVSNIGSRKRGPSSPPFEREGKLAKVINQ
ncbi:UL42 [Gallid alphaherpesvirus 2]|uniref:DNA polymerase processivity factor n=2 Tax=Gallid alphaherpesvirus 2 TaxID=10390 RepID=PAP_GAHVM|nr:DNA polymerase processivity subunit [Gallid alphaherpesvirus 2]Q77MR9.1 RecName: Full=DNA polymerase processivity factor; AltName: Full=DNA-binding protein UL42; AltName: Full=Polymerase accessory protein; Short=PAP [Marek's disease herpesvirus type 1 strain MD5]ACF49652.1 UL42 [synthetic construct]AAF66777.1 UL42 [Gallid alphaherpesvirus 2]AAG14235.1 UL42 DNA polymerase processivity subunit-like protein [Gallid alphaherpesvirus 2]AAS01684.1 DNA polymerase auxiliary subunit [Gallid alphaher